MERSGERGEVTWLGEGSARVGAVHLLAPALCQPQGQGVVEDDQGVMPGPSDIGLQTHLCLRANPRPANS